MSKLEEIKNKLQENAKKEREAQIRIEDEIDQWVFQLDKLYDHIEGILHPLKEYGISTKRNNITKLELDKTVEAPKLEISYRNARITTDPTLYIMGLKGRCDFKQQNNTILTLTPKQNDVQKELNWAIFSFSNHQNTGRKVAEYKPLTDDEFLSFIEKHLKI